MAEQKQEVMGVLSRADGLREKIKKNLLAAGNLKGTIKNNISEHAAALCDIIVRQNEEVLTLRNEVNELKLKEEIGAVTRFEKFLEKHFNCLSGILPEVVDNLIKLRAPPPDPPQIYDQLKDKVGRLIEMIKFIETPNYIVPEIEHFTSTVGKQLTDQMMFIECELRVIKERMERNEPGEDWASLKRVNSSEDKNWGEILKEVRDLSCVAQETKERVEECKKVVSEKIEEVKDELEEKMPKALLEGLSSQFGEELEALQGKADRIVDASKHIRKEMEAQREEAPSYARVAARNQVRISESGIDYANREYYKVKKLVVTSTGECDSEEELLRRLTDALRPVQNGIRIRGVNKLKYNTKERRICVTFDRINDCCKAKKVLEEKASMGLGFYERQGWDPLVALFGIPDEMTKDDIMEAIREQNWHLWEGLEEGKIRFSEKYRRRTKIPRESIVVLQVSPELYRRMLSKGRVYVGMRSITVRDQSPVLQCTLCLRYGHGRRQCYTNKARCSHCGDSHMKADCPQRAAGELPKCINCTHRSRRDHDAFDRSCPGRAFYDCLARELHDYGEPEDTQEVATP